jgi:hypothetical protein
LADRLSPTSSGSSHPHCRIRNAAGAGRSNAVVKEFRRSSELLRNILLSLSASTAAGSRRSSDGSTVSSLSTAAHSPSGPAQQPPQQQQQQQQQTTFHSAAESTSYYSSALQAHRKVDGQWSSGSGGCNHNNIRRWWFRVVDVV